MTKQTYFLRTVLTLIAMPAVFACDHDVTGPRFQSLGPVDPGALTMRVAPDNLVLPIGSSIQLTAELVRPDGTPVESMDREILWSSSDPTVALVSGSGLLEANSLGQAIISAAAAEGMAFTTVTVVSEGEIDPPYVLSKRRR